MKTDDLFARFNNFIQKSAGLQQALNSLRLDIELEINVGLAYTYTLKKVEGSWVLINHKATKPYAILALSPEGAETLLKSNSATIEEFLDVAFKLYLSGVLKVDLKGPILSLLTEASSEACLLTQAKLHQVLKTFGLESLSRKFLGS